MRKIKPLKTATGYIFFDLDGIEEILLPLIKIFIAMKKNALRPSPEVSFEEHFGLRELEEALVKDPQLTRDRLLAKQVSHASLIARQTLLILNEALISGGAVKTENHEAMSLLVKLFDYANSMVDAKSAILARQAQLSQQRNANVVEFAQMNRLPKYKT